MNIVIYTQPNCAFCDKAKALVDLLAGAVEVTYIDITKIPQAKEYFEAEGFTTVPQVFIEGEHIGGYEQFKDWAIREAR